MKVPDKSPQESGPPSAGSSDSAKRPLSAGSSELSGQPRAAGEPHAAGQASSEFEQAGSTEHQSLENAGGAESVEEPDNDRADHDEPDHVEAEQSSPSQSLAEAVGRLGLEISEDKIAKLDEYCQRLWKLNEQINLTRHTTYDLFARRDLLDTYELAKFIAADEEVLDVGTGGGVPGIPLAILRPDVKVSLCDSVAKKARVADTLVSQLKLPIYVHALRAQDVLEEHSFDTLVTRAAGSITQLCNWLNDYWHCFNRLLAIKGPRWVEERKEARHRGVLHGTVLRRIHGYRMPGTKSESVILQFHRPRPGSAS